MSGSGKDVSGGVGISWDEVRAGTFPDTCLVQHWMVLLKVSQLSVCILLVGLVVGGMWSATWKLDHRDDWEMVHLHLHSSLILHFCTLPMDNDL